MGNLRVLKNIARGQSLTRALMNEGLASVAISGTTLDIGGARNPDYFSFLQKKGEVSVHVVDGAIQKIDFEKDLLPYGTGSYDTAILCNVLEHIFNHQFLLGEVYRVLKGGGKLVGFVPFLFQVHPDPHDYFRYTKEALQKILSHAGFGSITIQEIGGGPFFVSYSTLSLSFPLVFRVLSFPLFLFLDSLFLKVRPRARSRYPLGYLFRAEK